MMEPIRTGDNPGVNKFLEDFYTFTSSWYPYIISFVIAVISGIRIYMAGPKCPSIQRVDGKVVVITGASSGIGFETARELAARGAKIILACRSQDKGQRAINAILAENPMAKLDLKIVDVSLMSSIREFAKQLESQYESIDVLINNAGVIFQPQSTTPEGYEITYATNYLGPFLLTHLLLPLLASSCNGRVINVTALAHFSVCLSLEDLNANGEHNPKEIFGKTKLALMLFTKHMSRLCRNLKVTVNAVNPGLVRNTNHFKQSSLASSFFTRLSIMPWVWLFLKTPNQGCQTTVFCAVEPYLDVTTGSYFSDCAQKDSAPATKNYRFAAELYKKTCQMLNVDSEKLVRELTQPI